MVTEDVSIRYRALDVWPLDDVVDALIGGQLAAAASVRAAGAELAAAAAAAADRLASPAGRIVYAGAGASGRIGVQDGVELFPTYGWPFDRLVYLMAGGEAALVRSVEGAEDDTAAARAKVAALDLGPADVILCVAASGRTPFTVAVAEAARVRDSLVIGLANNALSPLLAASHHPIALQSGPEVVAGSTRMGAGTAQKAALNVLSTAIMVRLKRVYDNLMVDLSSSNAKLDGRRLDILLRVAPASRQAAEAALREAGGHIKTASLILKGLDKPAAVSLLDRVGGDLRAAFEEISGREA